MSSTQVTHDDQWAPKQCENGIATRVLLEYDARVPRGSGSSEAHVEELADPRGPPRSGQAGTHASPTDADGQGPPGGADACLLWTALDSKRGNGPKRGSEAHLVVFVLFFYFLFFFFLYFQIQI